MKTTIQLALVNPKGTKRGKVTLGGVLIAIAVVMLLAGALAIGMFKTTSTVAVSSVQLRSSEQLPFGPGWAADYGTDVDDDIAIIESLPFGPGLAADYGTGSRKPMPFGPGLAATYGTRSERLGQGVLPFGPQIAANYGRQNDALAAIYALPFGPGWAATYGVPAH